MVETAKPTAPARDPLEVNDADFAAQFDAVYASTWGAGAIPAKYKELMAITQEVLDNAGRAAEATRQSRGKTPSRC